MRIKKLTLLVLLISLFTISSTKAAYNPYSSPDAIKVTNTAVANVNSSVAPVQFNNINTTAVVNTNPNIFSSVTSNGVVCAIPGTYMVSAILYQTSTAQRVNVGLQVTVDGVGTGVIGANGYIRSINGHNTASSNTFESVRLTSPNSKIGFSVQRLGNTGTVAVPVGQSAMRITRVAN